MPPCRCRTCGPARWSSSTRPAAAGRSVKCTRWRPSFAAPARCRRCPIARIICGSRMARAAPRNDRCYPQPHVAIPEPAPRPPARRSHARYWSDHRGRRAEDLGARTDRRPLRTMGRGAPRGLKLINMQGCWRKIRSALPTRKPRHGAARSEAFHEDAERCQATPGRLMLRPPLRRCRGICDRPSLLQQRLLCRLPLAALPHGIFPRRPATAPSRNAGAT